MMVIDIFVTYRTSSLFLSCSFFCLKKIAAMLDVHRFENQNSGVRLNIEFHFSEVGDQ